MDILSRNITAGNSFEVTKAMNVYRLSMQAQGADASYSGTFNEDGGLLSEYVPLLQGDTLLLSADPNSPIRLLIQAGSANVVLLLFYN